MNIRAGHFFNTSFMVIALVTCGLAHAAQAPNPRTSGAVTASGRADARDGVRASASSDSDTKSTVSRAATRRSTGVTTTRSQDNTSNNTSRTAASARSAVTTRGGVRGGASTTVAPMTVGRAASSGHVVRSATSKSGTRGGASTSNVSRAAMSRATAVFDDISKIGGGYAACREAYATCMDQFCAKANDTYRRCYCSSKFTEFRDTEDALDRAKTLLMRFEDNNLNAVDKTAAEVNAMYTATIGEAAIKKDTSAAQATLDEIGDLLSGKKKASTDKTAGLGLISVDLSTDMDDIWSGGVDSIFGTDSSDLSQMEGQALYSSANASCLKLIGDTCENNAVLKMARSSYSIMITQDCNAYEKKVNTQRESVKQTVRQAEKILRDARLEEYRAHNSADVNECLDKVKVAITQETACGANYKKCLDYTGALINPSTGEPNYTPRLFKLTEQITLDGSSDVVGANTNFNKFLDDKRVFATTALDSCRDLADIVWTEFKRSAIIEIAQAQEAKLEEIRMSCVSTMAECYDTQSGAIKEFDTATAKYADGLGAQAARYMCRDKVATCASLYGGTEECKFDNDSGKPANADQCGLSALFNFVDMVDSTRIAEGCETALKTKLKEDCTPTTGDMGYPWNCKTLELGDDNAKPDTIATYAGVYCGADWAKDNATAEKVNKIRRELKEEIEYQLSETCEKLNGRWIPSDSKIDNAQYGLTTTLNTFYSTVFAGNTGDDTTRYGTCYENTAQTLCLEYNDSDSEPVATYVNGECVFKDAWYKSQCESVLGGYWEGGMCYLPN